MIVLKIILWVLLALLLLIAAALAVPTRVFVRYTDEVFLQIRYLFLKITIPITEEQKAQKKPKRNKKEEKEKKTDTEKTSAEDKKSNKDRKEKKDKKKKQNPVVKWLKSLYNKGGVDAIITAFKDIASLAGNVLKPIFKNLRLRRLDIDITVAADNAADTAINYGRLCAGVYPALTLLLKIMKYDRYSVNIRPDFDKKALETDICAEIALVPWVVIGGAVHALVRAVGFKLKGEF